jgi:hypothetical protein
VYTVREMSSPGSIAFDGALGLDTGTGSDVVAVERVVVGQELLSAAADPVDISSERFYSALFGRHPLGRPVGGALPFPELDSAAVRAHGSGGA